MSFIYLAVEDELSEAVGKRIIAEFLGRDIFVQVLSRGGFGYLKSKLSNFVQMSRNSPVLLLTDLDNDQCGPSLKRKWFGSLEQPALFFFRVAVRETEAWLLADSRALSVYLGVSEASIPRNPETLADPKRELVTIARKAKKELRQDIVPERGSKSIQGIGYNRALCPFVERHWDIRSAAKNSDSLNRACRRIAALAG
ncbi:hypothetical protein [Rhizobium sp.]|uniref:hypothetical protein n=1 Tax=Rhizobium sp. TaxID=391 RepID=UPI000E94465F|nr:hypothetical protein [Rhizobium sp.]